MKKQFHTPDGIIERELTDEELIIFADDDDVRKETTKKELLNLSDSEKITKIMEYLRLV